MTFTGRRKILEMSRYGPMRPGGSDLVSGHPSNTCVKLRCNLTNDLSQGILRAALKFPKCRVCPEPPQ